MTSPAREHCYAALEASDQVANAMCHRGASRDNPAVERTLRELGAAMFALYGPLPDESATPLSRLHRALQVLNDPLSDERIVWHRHHDTDDI